LSSSQVQWIDELALGFSTRRRSFVGCLNRKSLSVVLAVSCSVFALGTGLSAADETPASIDEIRQTIEELDLKYTVEENWVTRLTPEEFSALCGVPLPYEPVLVRDWNVPARSRVSQLDWRNIDGDSYVSDVRNQGPCGSCWIFGAMAAIESAMMIALDEPNTDPDYAEQYVLGCDSWCGGCSGGYAEVALEFARLAGVPPEPCNPYEASDLIPCHTSCPKTDSLLHKIDDWGFVTYDTVDVSAINAALETYGPLATSFEVYESFPAYESGIYSAHGSTPTGGGHCVAIVGFNDSLQYWIAKNSWGEYWGEDGYFRIAYNSGCGFGAYTLACSYSPPWGNPVWTVPAELEAGETATVFYDPSGRLLDGAASVTIHRGHNHWTGVTNNPMVWNAGEEAWEVTFSIPSDAHNIQFVFNENDTLWDNNAWTDWYLPVDNTGDDFVMDGFLDPNVPLLSGDSEFPLHGWWLGDTLYVAGLSVGSTPSLDHFLLIFDDTTGVRSSVWGKLGNSVPWKYFLATENDNGWTGWFNHNEVIQTGASFDSARTGPYLEGTLDIDALYGGNPPENLWVAAAAYETPNGGRIDLQAPEGNGNRNLEASELFPLRSYTGLTIGNPVLVRRFDLSLSPNPTHSGTSVELALSHATDLRVEVFDAAGRKVATVFEGQAKPGKLRTAWDGCNRDGRPCASGIYFIKATGDYGTLTQKCSVMR
jgi:hypothetical protein